MHINDGAARMTMSDDLALAHELAAIAESISLSYFGNEPHMREKPDGTPVSGADLAVEHALIQALRDARPVDAILGEESGQQGQSTRRWTLDPIDGTAAFLEGKRSWGNHIALEVDGQVRVAVLTRPTEQLRWWATAGGGAYRGTVDNPLSTATRLQVSTTATLADARVTGYIPATSGALVALREACHWLEDDICPIGAVAEGRADAMLDEGGYPWDQAPAALIIKEAGGRFTDPNGGQRIDLRWNLYSNGLLHEELASLM